MLTRLRTPSIVTLNIEYLQLLYADGPVLAVEARVAHHRAATYLADRFRHRREAGLVDGLKRQALQYGQLRAEQLHHGVDGSPHRLAGGADPGDPGDELIQGEQVAPAGRPGRTHARRAVRQVLHSLQHPHGQPLAADGAAHVRPPRLGRLEADAAAPMPAQVVAALLGKELDRPLKPVAGL